MFKYLFWEKQAQDAGTAPSVPRQSTTSSPSTPSTPPASAPDPQAEANAKAEQEIKMQGQEQDLQHKQELHEQKMRHTEETHALKVQQDQPMGPEGQPVQPSTPEQAQAQSQSDILANYVQTKMGSDSPEEEEMAESQGNSITIEEVQEFLRGNQSPEDSEFHQWAESKGVSPHAAEELAYQLAAQQVTGKKPEDTVEGGEEEKLSAVSRRFRKVASELIQGGRAKDKKETDYSADQIRKGVKVEKEHTPDPAIAKEISKDHLEEFPDYYKALAKMEKGLDKKKTASALADSVLKKVALLGDAIAGNALGKAVTGNPNSNLAQSSGQISKPLSPSLAPSPAVKALNASKGIATTASPGTSVEPSGGATSTM